MLYKKVFVNIVFVTLCLYSAHTLDITDCGSYFIYSNIEFEGCDTATSLTCPLKIGTTMTISFDIYTGEININAELVNDVAFYVRGGPRFNLTVTPVNPCEVLQCPLEIDYNGRLSAEIYVDEKYQPLSNVDLRWILQTNIQEQLLCFQFPVTVEY